MNKVRDGYKITEIGDIPIEWEVRYLEDVCEILDSYRKPIKASDREEMKGDIPYYGASGVIDWINDFIFDEELILLGEDGENLNSRNTDLAFKISGKSWVNNHAHVFRIANKNRDNIDFMVYYLESKDYSRYIAGSAQPKITQAQCRKFLLPSPDLKEQEKIASILSTVDEQIDNVDALIEKNKELKKGLMQTLLTKGIGYTKFKTTEIGEIPEEWDVKKLECVFEILDSMRKPIKASDREKIEGNIPYYGASGVIDWINDYIFDEELILLGEDGENLNSRNSDLAFKISGKTWVNNHAHVFRVINKKECNIDFMVYYLEAKDYSIYIAGSAQPKITQAQCRKFLLPLPEKQEQDKIASILLESDKKIEEYENKKQKLEELKKGLMQELLTGNIRVNN